MNTNQYGTHNKRAHLDNQLVIVKKKIKAYHFFIWKFTPLDTAILSHSLLMFFPFDVAKEINFWSDLKTQNQSHTNQHTKN